MQKSLRVFLTSIVSNVEPHDVYISFWAMRLFMDHMVFIHQVGKKNASDAMLTFPSTFVVIYEEGYQEPD